MIDTRQGFRAIPPLLLVAFAVDIVFTLFWLAEAVSSDFDAGFTAGQRTVFEGATWLLIFALMLFGTLGLARRLVGIRAVGARIAGFAWAGGVVLQLAGSLVFEFGTTSGKIYFELQPWLWAAIVVMSAVGFALVGGGWRKAPGLATAIVGLACLETPFPPVRDLIQLVTSFGPQTYWIWNTALHLATIGVTILLTITATRASDAAASDGGVALATPSTFGPENAAHGLRTVASSLWLRLIAAASIAGLTLLIALGESQGSAGLLKFAVLAGQIINVIGLVLLGLGAIRASLAEHQDLPRGWLAVAAALSLWAGAAMLVQTPSIYEWLFKQNAAARATIEAFGLAIPIVAVAAVAAIILAVSRLAAARDDADLRYQVTSRGLTFVVLSLGSVAIGWYGLTHVDSIGKFVFVSLATAVCGFIAMMQAAKLFTAAAVVVASEPGLPTATLRSRG